MPTIPLRWLNLNPTCRIILAVSIRDSEGYQCPKHGEDNFFLSRFFLGENLLDVTTLNSRNNFPNRSRNRSVIYLRVRWVSDASSANAAEFRYSLANRLKVPCSPANRLTDFSPSTAAR